MAGRTGSRRSGYRGRGARDFPGGESRYLYAAGYFGVLRYDLSLLPPHCDASPTTLCLQHGRFSATLRGTFVPIGPVPPFPAVPVTSESGYFWIFGPDNVEVMVKVLDGTAVNDHFWVFYGSLSDVGYMLTITDNLTGESKDYVNPQGTLASVADTQRLSQRRLSDGDGARARGAPPRAAAIARRSGPACPESPGRPISRSRGMGERPRRAVGAGDPRAPDRRFRDTSGSSAKRTSNSS